MPNTSDEESGQKAERRAMEAVQEASPWVDRIARFGYATKGLVYVVVGVLAIGAATGMGGRTTDPPGALQTIGAQPFGPVMLGFVALGLAGYALWRLFQTVADPEAEGRDAFRVRRQLARLLVAGTRKEARGRRHGGPRNLPLRPTARRRLLRSRRRRGFVCGFFQKRQPVV